nr:hypothetical protein [Methanosphaera stadtmanae]
MKNTIIMGKKNKYNTNNISALTMGPITVVAAIIMINKITGITTVVNIYSIINEFNFSEYSLYLICILREFSLAKIFKVSARLPPLIIVLFI